MLTLAHENTINNAAYTHNFANAAIAEWETTNTNVINKYTEMFETQTNVLTHALANDIGGVIVYFSTQDATKLVAFYDYERFVGTVF
jgi:hypothetical protein